MKLRIKLLVAFLTTIVLPITLIIGTSSLIIKQQLKSIEKSYDVSGGSLDVIQNPIRIMNNVTRDVYNQIKLEALKEPSKLVSEENIISLNQHLVNKYSFLVVRKNGEIIFTGNTIDKGLLESSLPAFGDYSVDADGGYYLNGQTSYLLKQQDVYLDSDEYSIFVVTSLNTLVPQIKGFVVEFCISLLMIILFTAVLITGWLYNFLIKPINKLRFATCRMKEGDLSYSLKSSSKDEIGLLCEDFEEMRLKLKELIDTKLQYEQSSKELISNISHDLKTPITAIKGYTEGILDGVADTPEKREKYLKTIYTKANDLAVLVDELSLYSKLDTDTIPYNFMKVNLHQYFNDCINDLMLDLEVKNIDIGYFNYANHNLNIMLDTEQMKRVINNIIGNSVKYMDKKPGIINIRISEEEDSVNIQIEDNGRGIREADQNRIFDRFYRADSSRNSATGGSGLGLAIAKKIVEDHGGTISVNSKEGMGTIISLSLKKEMKVDEQDTNH